MAPKRKYESDETRPPKKERFKPVTARTATQKEYIDALYTNDIVFGVGPAGTGKTYLAIAMALEALRNGSVDKIILTRPAVEAGENLGYLPGDLGEKIAPYLRPLFDAMGDIASHAQLQKMHGDGRIEIAPLAFMRGRTLNNAFIILDEAQNTTTMQMKMLLTRMGENSKIIVTGDMSQSDLARGVKSGLTEATERLNNIEGIAIIKFNERDVVRHALVKQIINAYEEFDACTAAQG